MRTLNELIGPIPLIAIALTVFALVFLWSLSRFFRMPDNFTHKEDVRDEIRYRLFDEQQAAEEAEAAKAAKDEAAENKSHKAAEESAPTDAASASPAESKHDK